MEIKKLLLDVLPTLFSNPNRKVNGFGWFNLMVTQHDLEIYRGHQIPPLYMESSVVIPKIKGMPQDYR